MRWPARPTLRCLKYDLCDDWDSVDQMRAVALEQARTPFHLLGHPVVRHAAEQFPAGDPPDASRESISGLSDLPWWKVKTGRWRGAVYEDPETGQAWLCAAGLRRERELTDFYKEFIRSVLAGGPEQYLPTEDDHQRLVIEQRDERLSRWERQLQVDARAALDAAKEVGSSSFEVRVPKGDGDHLTRVDLEVTRIHEDDPAEGLVELVASFARNWRYVKLLDWAEQVVLATIDAYEQHWDAGPTGDASVYSLTLSELEFDGLGGQTLDVPGATVPGREAHYTHRERVIENAVNGTAVRALCGVWFVPRQDHESKPKCAACDALYRSLDP